MNATNRYSFEVEKVAKGTKTHVKIFRDGELLAERTSPRPYRRVMIAKLSRAYAIENAKGNINYYRNARRDAWSAEERAARIIEHEKALAELQSGAPIAKYENSFVASWHMGKVPNAPKHLEFVEAVELPVSE